jgi:hypothetical protein
MLHTRQVGTYRRAQQQLHPLAVHDVGGVDVECDNEPFGVDQHMALAPDQLLGPVLPADASHAGGRDGLAVDAAGARLGIAVQPHT